MGTMGTKGMNPSFVQDCLSFAGPVDGNVDSCLETDFCSCSAYIGEECQYVGERLGIKIMAKQKNNPKNKNNLQIYLRWPGATCG